MGQKIQRKNAVSEEQRQRQVDRLLERAGLEVRQSPEGYRAIQIKLAASELAARAPRSGWRRRVR